MDNSPKKFYVVEYLDDEGETVIKHLLLTHEEAVDTFAKIVSDGVLATMYELGTKIVDENPPNVLFNDVPRLGTVS